MPKKIRYELKNLQKAHNEIARKIFKRICLCSEYYICTFIISFYKMYESDYLRWFFKGRTACFKNLKLPK